MLEQIIASRSFTMAYIWLDIVFLVLLAALLVYRKKFLALLWGLAGGILYLIVDYGIFYLLMGSRSIYIGGVLQGSSGTFLILLWMSLSYGMTNFIWIWLCLERDEHLREWTFMIFGWWIVCPMLSEMAPASTAVQTARTTAGYHWVMALILFVCYMVLIIYNMYQRDPRLRVNILWLCVIGVTVQFGWEFGLLIGGIRSSGADIAPEEKLRTLVVNSLLETNLGMPGIYAIFLAVTSKWEETLKRKHRTMGEELLANNRLNKRFKEG